MKGDEFRKMALEFPGTETAPHFDRVAFKVIKRRAFATYLETDNTANIFLTPEEQNAFCRMDKKNIFPVPNKWGEKGATTFVLDRVDLSLVREALLSAYSEIVGR
ncbi:MAG: MmcQ/YjbR family DNA-binding protein [Pyrinomonadaceae bacterium]